MDRCLIPDFDKSHFLANNLYQNSKLVSFHQAKHETVILTITEKIIYITFIYGSILSSTQTHCILQSPTFSRLDEKKSKVISSRK